MVNVLGMECSLKLDCTPGAVGVFVLALIFTSCHKSTHDKTSSLSPVRHAL